MNLTERMRAAQQVPFEIEELERRVIAHAPKTAVEIGTAKGGTLARWLRIPSVEIVVSVDLPEGIYGGASLADRQELTRLASEEAKARGIQFFAIDGPSAWPTTVIKTGAALQARAIDFLFIDGDHSYEGVKKDFELYSPLVDGLIVFHDIVYHTKMKSDVPLLWKELKGDYEHYEFVSPLHNDLGIGVWGGIGVLEHVRSKEPAGASH